MEEIGCRWGGVSPSLRWKVNGDQDGHGGKSKIEMQIEEKEGREKTGGRRA